MPFLDARIIRKDVTAIVFIGGKDSFMGVKLEIHGRGMAVSRPWISDKEKAFAVLPRLFLFRESSDLGGGEADG
jgi:hypothetical protein